MWIFGNKYIKNGELDRILVKPVNPLFQIIAEKLNYQGISQIIAGSFALSLSLRNIDFNFSYLHILYIFGMIVCSGLIFSGIHLFYMTLSIWMIDSQPVVSSIFSLNQFATYPIMIFPKIIQWLLLFIVPYAFTGFIPANLFFRPNEYSKYIYTVPIVAITVCFIGYSFWLYGLKHYESTGI